jgi:predicted amidohydrolase
MIRITAIQLEVKDQSKQKNLASVLRLLDEAPVADLLLLPELWPSGFFSFDSYRADSEEIDGPLITAVREKVAEKAVHTMIGSFVERDGDNLYNTSLVLGPDGDIFAKYRKIHLFGFQSQEKQLLTPGNEVTVVDLPWGRAGISTCYDLRFPELYRLMVDQGATFFLVASAWPLARLSAWQLFNQARAHENLAYLISCNCAGASRGIAFAGHSMIIDPLGKILVQSGEAGGYVTAEIDQELPTRVRKEFSALDDRIYRVIDRR